MAKKTIDTAETTEASETIPFEEKLWLFWSNHKSIIFIALIAACALGAFFPAVSFYKSKKLASLQEAFRSAQTAEEQAAFIASYPSEPLAGISLLELADDFYIQKDFDQALVHYNKAIISLEATPLIGRVHVGVAMAYIQKNDLEIGKKMLEATVNNSSLMDIFRAEAAYHLALTELEADNAALASQHLKSIQRLVSPGIWGQKALMLLSSLPELKV